MSVRDFQSLEEIARRLAHKYPPDWLERKGQSIYASTLAASFVLAALIGLAWGPWWGFLVPLLAPGLVLIVLPRCLFGRDAGRPRWAHPLAALDRQDAELVGRIAALGHDRKVSGERFFDIWRQVQACAGPRNA